MTADVRGATEQRRSDGVMHVLRAERRKLAAQVSTRVLALVCALGPLGFAIALKLQSGVPADTLLGTWVHTSGYAVSLVVLGFAGYLGFAVLAGVLAGDLFSSEDRYGTWKTTLTRSSTRREVFLGKVLAVGAFAAVLVCVAAASSIVAGLVLTGDQPVVGLSGATVASGEGLALVIASWLVSVPPVLALTSLAVLFSVATRQGIVGVIGPILVVLVMQLLALIGSGTWVHTLLLASAFDGWHGLLATPRFYGPLLVGTLVCLVWIVGSLGAAWMLFRRRDFAGPPVPRRIGWTSPARVVLGAAALIVVLAAATNLGPSAITPTRLEASIAPAFNSLTALQQRELGRRVPAGSKLDLRTACSRHAGARSGPGDDWSCTMTVVGGHGGAAGPLQLTPVTYDVSVKSNGCYKADAPPSFVGQQMMSLAGGHRVVNPLFTIYGCFDTLGAAPACTTANGCVARAPARQPGGARSGAGAGSAGARGPAGATRESPARRKAQSKALREAERRAGPQVMREITESERREQQQAEHPESEAEGEAEERARAGANGQNRGSGAR